MTPSEALPPNPSLRQSRHQAKDLLRAHRAGEPDALRRIGQSHPRFSGSSQAEIAAAEIRLADAQLVIARELGFRSWPKLKAHVESLSSPPSTTHERVPGKEVEDAAAEIEKLGGRCDVDGKGQVRTVSLKGPRFTDAMAEHLRGLTGLERLYLVKTQVGDSGLAHLKGLTDLERLCLGGTQVTDAGLEHLKELTGLRRLDLRATQVGDVGADELSKALPNCRIYR